MSIGPLPFPSLGVDCLTKLDDSHVAGLYQAGIRFSIRYLGSVTAEEVQTILQGGLAFMPVTYSRAPGWTPTPGMGVTDGHNDLAHLAAAQIPIGVTVWIDLEGCAGDEHSCANWVNERSSALRDAGYDAGLYVGANQPMSGPQLAALPYVDRYWRSLSRVPEPPIGWSMMQLYKTTMIAGVEVDVDCVQYDYKGRLPYAMLP